MAKDLRFYRANKSNSGVAASFELSYKKDEKYDKYHMFLVMANQTGTDQNTGNAQFDWDNAITVKMGDIDIGEFLAVLENRKQNVGKNGLFHQTANTNKIIKFEKQQDSFRLGVSCKTDGDEKPRQISMILGVGEVTLLHTLLRRTVEKMYGW